jgi:hypothetical protein
MNIEEYKKTILTPNKKSDIVEGGATRGATALVY